MKNDQPQTSLPLFPEDNLSNNHNEFHEIKNEPNNNDVRFNLINNMMEGKSLEGYIFDEGMKRIGNMNSWINVYNLKYYFTVNNSYVLNKLKLLIFPFKHKVKKKKDQN